MNDLQDLNEKLTRVSNQLTEMLNRGTDKLNSIITDTSTEQITALIEQIATGVMGLGTTLNTIDETLERDERGLEGLGSVPLEVINTTPQEVQPMSIQEKEIIDIEVKD